MNSGVKAKNNIDSPKTPGGISKSLLTPCRRVGLSRNWGKRGPSPFISPLSSGNSNSGDVKVEKEPKRRKRCRSDDEESASIQEIESVSLSTPKSRACDTSSNINSTPIRVPLSKKMSKTLLMKDTKESVNTDSSDIKNVDKEESKGEVSENISNKPSTKQASSLSTLSRSNLKNILKHQKLSDNTLNLKEKSLEDNDKTNEKDEKNIQCENSVKTEINPNNLTKECIVVIQKKMIKSLNLSKIDKHDEKPLPQDSTSQTLFDSDSDDTPLCALSNKININTDKDNEEDDFADNKVKILPDKNTSTTVKTKNKRTKKIEPKMIETTSRNYAFEDDDDFECLSKRTILIKKSYDKVVKPSKAKSTGSITQRDIDEIKARIDMKKQLLVAKSMSEDTEELRSLIKKWQKGCQEALFELFDLMRKKFPDQQKMDYSEILQTLKIPSELVGYDVDNDCFVTPDDTSIILSSINT